MKNIIFSLLVLVTITFGSGCERVIDVDLNEADPMIAFEGWISDDPGPYEIKVTRTANVFSADEVTGVSGAQVIVTDDSGAVDTLVEVSPGIYHTTTLQGQIGHTYTLHATVDGIEYTGTDYLPRIAPFLGIAMQHFDSTFALGEGDYVVTLAQETQGIGDYYLFRFYRNDTLYDDASDYLLFEDRFVDGNLVPFLWPYHVEPGDTVVTEVRSITRASYDFYYTFIQSQFGSGGPFGAPPDNLIGNISNEGLGYFGSYGVVRDTIIVP